jgi:hypothetical protein
MMKGFASLLILFMALGGATASYAFQGPPPGGRYGPPPPLQPGWDNAPGTYRSDIERRAYQEGIRGARKDRENGRAPNVNNRDEYLRRTAFPVPNQMLPAYRHAFRAGYNRGVQMFYNMRR